MASRHDITRRWSRAPSELLEGDACSVLSIEEVALERMSKNPLRLALVSLLALRDIGCVIVAGGTCRRPFVGHVENAALLSINELEILLLTATVVPHRLGDWARQIDRLAEKRKDRLGDIHIAHARRMVSTSATMSLTRPSLIFKI